MPDDLATRIERRISKIPANNPGYISFSEQTLSNVLSSKLLRKIAEEAAAEAKAKE